MDKAIHGSLREGNPHIGTCACSNPASNIDFHVVHKRLADMVTQSHIDLVTHLSPHRPVWATLHLIGGAKVPVQKVLKLPCEGVLGPARAPKSNARVANILAGLDGIESLEKTKAQIQQDINDCYSSWRGTAAQEALQANDQDVKDFPRHLRRAAGGKIQIKWVDPRRAVRPGRKQLPSWAAGCSWLEVRLKEMIRTIKSMETDMAKSGSGKR